MLDSDGSDFAVVAFGLVPLNIEVLAVVAVNPAPLLFLERSVRGALRTDLRLRLRLFSYRSPTHFGRAGNSRQSSVPWTTVAQFLPE